MFYILATSFLTLNSQGNAKFKTKFLLGDCGSAASEPKATELIHADANKLHSVAQQCPTTGVWWGAWYVQDRAASALKLGQPPAAGTGSLSCPQPPVTETSSLPCPQFPATGTGSLLCPQLQWQSVT